MYRAARHHRGPAAEGADAGRDVVGAAVEDGHVLDGDAQRVGANLGQHRLVALSHGRDAKIDLSLALLGYQHPRALEGAEAGGFDIGRDADAVIAALLVRPLPGGQLVVADFFQRAVEGAGVVAAVVDSVAPVQAGLPHVVGHFTGLDHVAAAQFRRINSQVGGGQVQHPLADEGSLEEAGAR